MLTRFLLSFFRAHRFHLLRMGMILFLTSIAFLLVGAITDLVESKIQSETRTLLGADITLESNQRPSDSDREFLRQLSETFDIEIASNIDFQTNLSLESGEILLSDVKIVSQNFPLNGTSFMASGSGVYVSDALQSSLKNNSSIELGGNYYEVKGSIPPSTFGAFSLFTEGREVWIPEEYAQLDELLGLGARVEYTYFINIAQDDISSLRNYLHQDGVFETWRVEDINSRQDRVATIFSELERFLQVFFIGIYVLAFFSLFFTFEALRRITGRDIGLFILLGYTKRNIFFALGILLIIITSIAFFFALLSVFGAIYVLSSFPLTESIHLDISIITQSFFLSALILLFSIFTPLRSLLSASIGNLLKQSDIQSLSTVTSAMIFSLFGGIVTLLFLLGANIIWIFIVSTGFLVSFLLLAGVVRIYFLSLFGLAQSLRKKYFSFFYTLRSTIRPGNMTLFITLPVMIVGSVFFFFIVFALSFLDATRVPESSNNYFVLNIGEQEKISLESAFQQLQIYDILLARIVAINDIPLRDVISESAGRGEFTREFNLTTHPLPDNLYELGTSLTENGVSVDIEFAERLGIGIGDDIRFLLSGREVSFEVQNLRPAVRGDFRPFFYFQLRPEDLSGLERSYFATLSDTQFSQEELQAQLFDISPRLQLLDLTATLSEVSRILGQVYTGVLSMTFYIAGFVWILLSVSLTILGYIRQKEASVLMLLGASQKFCRNNLALEYFILLSFASLGVILIGSVASVYFFYNLSFLDVELITLLQASIIILFGTVCLFLSLIFPQFIKSHKKVGQDME